MRSLLILLPFLALTMAGRAADPSAPAGAPVVPADGVWRILPIGDSITQGGTTFANWRWPLWERLTAAGYFVRYVGSQTSPSRIGPLAHEGHGGKNAEFLAARLASIAPEVPADIVLLHAGHNHFADERPVAGIVAAQESIIASCRAANPRVIALVAKVIPSGKQPKYSYIPELNKALETLARRLNTPQSPVRVVDQADGFDPATDTIADRVHPNQQGAAKMAGRWFQALRAVLPAPAVPLPMPRLVPYKDTTAGPLALHVFDPPDGAPPGPPTGRPAVVLFFGGGWTSGTPLQFYPECRHFAARGLVAIAADYRIAATHGTSPFEAVADAKSAIRFVRAHSGALGVDHARIVAAGASAGGQLAAAAACLAAFDDPADDLRVSARPDALLLWYPVIDNGPEGYGHDRVGDRFREFSPLHHVRPGFPPALILLGTADRQVPVATARDFQQKVRAAGGRCDLRLFDGAPHPIYPYRSPGAAALRAECLAAADQFLDSLGSAAR